jgi:ribosomal protein S18 acetylase RimI-like enzyme
MRLIPFQPAAAATVAGWARSADEASRWCAQAEYPFPPDAVRAWQDQDDVTGYLLVDDDDRPVAYGEVWSDEEEAEAELARLIVDPDRRGMGIGHTLVTELVRRAGYNDIFMRVVPTNDQALACYRGAGFVDVDETLAAQWNAPQPISYTWLRYAV